MFGRPKLGLLLTGSMISLGCSTAPPEPAWPQQPTPSYPTRNTNADESAGQPPAQAPSEPEAKTSASQLAKEYGDKAALDSFGGKATYYADSLAGNHTANGDVYDPDEFTAAHKKLPFGTILRVVRVDTKATTYVRVNDRGPFGPADRVIDLSKAAAKELDMMRAGVVAVRVEIVERPKKK